jgi:hypothetical protein
MLSQTELHITSAREAHDRQPMGGFVTRLESIRSTVAKTAPADQKNERPIVASFRNVN